MFWKRTTGHGAFCGLLAGTAAAALTHGLTVAEGKGGWIAPVWEIRSGMGQAFIVAGVSWIANFTVTVLVSLATKPKSEHELKGLVYSFTKRESAIKSHWYLNPVTLGVLLLLATILLNIIFF
jgi:SSS family solute:Na+ symporter